MRPRPQERGFPAAATHATGDGDPAEFTREDLERVMNPARLEMISRASGFRYVLIDEVPPGMPQHVMGFTDPVSKAIYLVRGNIGRLVAQFQQEGADKAQAMEMLRGFLIHEGGHHAPAVLPLDHKLRDFLGAKKGEPQELSEYFKNAEDNGETLEAFWQAFWYDCCNGPLDMWLESYQSREVNKESLAISLLALHGSSVEGRQGLTRLPLHHQLVQWMVGEEGYYKKLRHSRGITKERRRTELEAAAQRLVSPEVAKVIKKLRDTGVLDEITNRDAWEAQLDKSSQQEDLAIQRKFKVIIDHLYPAWWSLFRLEFEKRKAAVREAAAAKVPPIPEDQLKPIYAQILKDLLGVTKKLGEEAFGSATPAPDDAKALGDKFIQIKGSAAGKGDQPPAPHQKGPTNMERARQDAARALNEREDKRIEDLAGRFGVSEEALRKQQEIEAKYEGDIQRLADHIAESFLTQRRAKIEHNRLEGFIEPGMEGIDFAEVSAGNMDARTRFISTVAPEFLQTEMEFLFDTSGSMQNERLEFSRIACIIISRAFERVKKALQDEGLLNPDEEDPLRTGIVVFTTHTLRVKKLDEPTKDNTLAQMIEQTGRVSGGTDDAAAIEALTTEFKMRDDRVLKFLTIFSDGEGNQDGVQHIMHLIEKDPSIVVLVVAMGANQDAVAATYGSAAREQGKTNVFVVQGDNISENVEKVAKFLKRTIREKAESL